MDGFAALRASFLATLRSPWILIWGSLSGVVWISYQLLSPVALTLSAPDTLGTSYELAFLSCLFGAAEGSAQCSRLSRWTDLFSTTSRVRILFGQHLGSILAYLLVGNLALLGLPALAPAPIHALAFLRGAFLLAALGSALQLLPGARPHAALILFALCWWLPAAMGEGSTWLAGFLAHCEPIPRGGWRAESVLDGTEWKRWLAPIIGWLAAAGLLALGRPPHQHALRNPR